MTGSRQQKAAKYKSHYMKLYLENLETCMLFEIVRVPNNKRLFENYLQKLKKRLLKVIIKC